LIPVARRKVRDVLYDQVQIASHRGKVDRDRAYTITFKKCRRVESRHVEIQHRFRVEVYLHTYIPDGTYNLGV
jgi:hypothetical protein